MCLYKFRRISYSSVSLTVIRGNHNQGGSTALLGSTKTRPKNVAFFSEVGIATPLALGTLTVYIRVQMMKYCHLKIHENKIKVCAFMENTQIKQN